MRIAYQAFLGTNYGTVLQTFALFKKLESIAGINNIKIIGCSNFRNRPEPDQELMVSNKQLYLAQVMRKNFEAFIEDEMKFSQRLDYIRADGFIPDNNKSAIDDYDAFVCGSDQVWRPSKFWFCPKRYMTYAHGKKTIGYAPSVVINKVKDIPKQYFDDWKKYLSNITYLSTREIGSSFLIQNLVNKECKYVVDPTLLFNYQTKIYFIKKIQLNNFLKMKSMRLFIC